MTKEYLKMADKIPGVVTHGISYMRDGNGDAIVGSKLEYAAHAISYHDELVAEVKKLRSELADAWFMVDEIKLSLDRRSKQAEYWESIAKE
jgi:hypothetical protein